MVPRCHPWHHRAAGRSWSAVAQPGAAAAAALRLVRRRPSSSPASWSRRSPVMERLRGSGAGHAVARRSGAGQRAGRPGVGRSRGAATPGPANRREPRLGRWSSRTPGGGARPLRPPARRWAGTRHGRARTDTAGRRGAGPALAARPAAGMGGPGCRWPLVWDALGRLGPDRPEAGPAAGGADPRGRGTSATGSCRAASTCGAPGARCARWPR